MSSVATEFKLWDKSPDPWAWILYGTRYSQEVLEAKQAQMVAILEEIFEFQDRGEDIAVSPKEDGVLASREKLLLEELACINEALEFHKNRPHWAWKWLNNLLRHDARMEISRESARNLVWLYNSIDMGLGQIIRDLTVAQDQNEVMTRSQQRLFATFIKSKIRAIELLQGKHIIINP